MLICVCVCVCVCGGGGWFGREASPAVGQLVSSTSGTVKKSTCVTVPFVYFATVYLSTIEIICHWLGFV
jgi:hypothetical protein